MAHTPSDMLASNHNFKKQIRCFCRWFSNEGYGKIDSVHPDAKCTSGHICARIWYLTSAEVHHSGLIDQSCLSKLLSFLTCMLRFPSRIKDPPVGAPSKKVGFSALLLGGIGQNHQVLSPKAQKCNPSLGQAFTRRLPVTTGNTRKLTSQNFHQNKVKVQQECYTWFLHSWDWDFSI